MKFSFFPLTFSTFTVRTTPNQIRSRLANPIQKQAIAINQIPHQNIAILNNNNNNSSSKQMPVRLRLLHRQIITRKIIYKNKSNNNKKPHPPLRYPLKLLTTLLSRRLSVQILPLLLLIILVKT